MISSKPVLLFIRDQDGATFGPKKFIAFYSDTFYIYIYCFVFRSLVTLTSQQACHSGIRILNF